MVGLVECVVVGAEDFVLAGVLVGLVEDGEGGEAGLVD